jgi:hypothetical protein
MNHPNASKRKNETSAEQHFAAKRNRERADEYQESFSLLLELVHQEPTLAQAFRIIQTQVLQGQFNLHIDGVAATPAFMTFAEDHYTPFCKDAIKAMFTYGFVPWRFRCLQSGDIVPEVLPAGTFTWSIILSNSMKMEGNYGDDISKTLLYDVKLLQTADDITRGDVFIFETTQPTWNIAQGSNLSASYPSPLSHIIADYKNLRVAMNNKSHADAWNSHVCAPHPHTHAYILQNHLT